MRHSDAEVELAARRLEAWLDEVDPQTLVAEDPDDLRGVARAADDMRAAEAGLHAAVATARARGRSWNMIAVALGVSRQAARQRFSERAS